MKTLYFMATNGYNMVVSVDEENNARYLVETDEFPYIVGLDEEQRNKRAAAFLDSIVDDSEWESGDVTELFTEDNEILVASLM